MDTALRRSISLASAAILALVTTVASPLTESALAGSGQSARHTAASSMKPSAPAASPAPRAADGSICTIWGSKGKNRLKGTPGNDVICGLGGDDTINGGGGDDIIDGGAGNDTLVGGSGNDTLIGGAGNDKLDGQSGADTASYVDAKTAVKVNLATHKKQKIGRGSDTLVGVENLTGGSGNDALTGDSHANVIDGGRGNDKLYGGSGNDTLIGGTGNDRMDGQSGTDRVSYASARTAGIKGLAVAADTGAAGVNVSLDTSKAQNTGDGVDTLLSDEGLVGSAGDDTLVGNSGANLIDGGSGNDTLSGGAGNDTLTGDAGSDVLTGGAGDDRIDGGPNPDNLDGGAGANICTFDAEDTVAPNCDGTGPQVLGLSLSTDSVDASTSDQTISVTVHITDDLAGMKDGVVSFTNPNSPKTLGFYVWGPPNPFSILTSGDARDGVYTGTLTIPAGTVSGTWVASVDINDAVGNRSILSASDLAKAGIAASFTQVGAGDSGVPPQLAGLELSRTSLDTSASAQELVVTAHITDDAGLSHFTVSFVGPSSSGKLDAPQLNTWFADEDRISGDAKDGVYRKTITVPRYSAQGFWKLTDIEMSDKAGNNSAVTDLKSRGLVDGFTQTGPGDSKAPTLVSLSMDPSTVHVADSDQTITVTARVSDDLAGLKVGSAIFNSAEISSQQIITYFDPDQLIDGTATDGTYRWSFTVPRYSATGKWNLQLSLCDTAGNVVYLYADQLTAGGFPSGFTIN